MSQYDWGATGEETLLSSTNTSYWITGRPTLASDEIHILDRIETRSVSGPNCDSVCNSQTYSYDDYTGPENVGLIPTSGIAGHDDTPRSSLRGNVTSISDGIATRWLSYNDLGKPIAEWDGRGKKTAFDYTDNFRNGGPSQSTLAFPTKVIYPATTIAHEVKYQYYWQNGEVAAQCGQNAAASGGCAYLAAGGADITSYEYDVLGRTKKAVQPDGAVVTISYVTPNRVDYVSATGKQITAEYDGFGRISARETTSVTPHVRQETGYDAFGRVSHQTNPFLVATSRTTDGDTGYTYDALGRPKTIAESGDTRHYEYSGNTTSLFDETSALKSKQTVDSMGRIAKVVEDPNGLNLVTQYSYDAAGNLVAINQQGNVGAGDIARSRSFKYDSVSRLRFSLNPEAGPICYGTMSNGLTPAIDGCNCIAGYDENGNLLSKTDARNIVIRMHFDDLNRMDEKWSSSSTGQVVSNCYQYDTSNSAASNANLKGRLALEWTQSARCATPSTVTTSRSILTYNAMGLPTSEQQCVLSRCFPGLTFDYNSSGQLKSHGTGAPGLVLQYDYDPAERLYKVSSSISDATHPPDLMNVTEFYGHGVPRTFDIGNSMTGTDLYDSRLRNTGSSIKAK